MIGQKKWKNFDFTLVFTAVVIFGMGLVFLYSATYQFSFKPTGSILQSFVIRQIVWFILAILVGVVIVKVGYQKWLELAYPLYGLNILFLLLVLVWGEARLGAQRWISFGNIAFQPSEFSKLVIILTLARYLGQKGIRFHQDFSGKQAVWYKKKLAVPFLIVGLPFVLIVKQPDLGTALTLVPILFAILFVWGVHLRTLALISAAFALSSPLLWQMLKEYQKRRILVFINPNLDPLGAGYTVIQSKIAIGSGRLFGKGWLAGTQSQLNFLPERHSDFIFSVVGEEWGFVGAVLLVVLYFVLIWRAFSIAQGTANLSGRLLICGIIAMLSFQVVINISMTMGFLPVVGLPLPLISYGGSSLLTTAASIALILNIGMRRAIF